jgi:hypothetical protein
MLLLLVALVFIYSCERGEIDNYYLGCETADGDLDRNLDNLGLDNSIVIKFNNGDEPAVYNPYENEIAIALNGENAIVQNLSFGTEYNLIVSGATENGSLKIYGNRRMGLYLNGVNIVNPNGLAINIQNRQKISVHLVDRTANYLADGASYSISSEDAKGTFFSEGPIYFSGCGALAVAGKYAHAIAVDNDFEIESGIITVKTTGVKSHGISSSGSTIISGNANVKIEVSGNGAKGIKSDGFIAIRGGTTDIKTSGSNHIDNSVNPPDTSSAPGIKANGNMEISGGTLIVKAVGAGAKGINVDGNLTMTDGDIKIDANDDGIKVHGNLLVSNGNLCAWSFRKQNIDCAGAEAIKNGTVNSDKCAVGF